MLTGLEKISGYLINSLMPENFFLKFQVIVFCSTLKCNGKLYIPGFESLQFN